MKDLVGVRVADSREEPRIGQRALDRMVLAGERGAKAREVGFEDLEPSARMLGDGLLAADQVEGGAFLRTRFGQYERPLRKVERRERRAAGEPRAPGTPVETARDHQMEDEVQVALEVEDDSLAEAAEPHDSLSDDRGDRRLEGPQQERAREPHLEERPSNHPGLERGQVGGDVGKLRHRGGE